MSELHKAVQAEISAHTPTRPPSFDALQHRKHTRDRRRSIAAVTATALAVAGVAVLPAALAGGSGGSTAPAPVAQEAGDGEVFGFGVKASDAEVATAEGGGGPEALQRCLELPGLSNVSAQYSYPGQYSGLVTGSGKTDAFKSCVDAVPGWAATLTRVAPGTGMRSYTVRPAAKTVGNPRVDEQRDACFALPGADVISVEQSDPATYRVIVPARGAEAFEKCIGDVVGLYVPELGRTRAASADIKAPPPVRIERTDDFGRISDISRNGTSLRMERVDMLSGQEAEQAAAEAGADFSNDYFLRQRPEFWTTHTIDPDVVVWGSIRMAGSVDPVRVDLARLIEFIDKENSSETSALFHLHIEAGRVVAIEEQYLP